MSLCLSLCLMATVYGHGSGYMNHMPPDAVVSAMVDVGGDNLAAAIEEVMPNEKEAFRNFSADAATHVLEFYQANHQFQTYEANMRKRIRWLGLNTTEMGIWEAMEYLDALIDDSDPDTRNTQIQHNLQTAEAIRRDGHPRWFQLTGLIHDLGKILALWGEPQYFVVGDTFPVGVQYAPENVYPQYFESNADYNHEVYSTPLGIYEDGCGINNLFMSWGHDEYLYHVVKDYLPEEALAMIRFHSFYPWHKHGAYMRFMAPEDEKLLEAVKMFNPYDLYSKDKALCDVEELKPYYQGLIDEFFPPTIKW